ncbi:major capsid protein [Intestinirhabdus alba]|uniref:Phage capsid protein n=1 Tax=Intestinirhabdus alba TaxID=2899544 RepID=A0A6L6IHI1_9ENTR|nr:major capsid protein [Intestinirhabdus alba]MTH46049.1 phage capsid protein [Intestinirhabdus alba]
MKGSFKNPSVMNHQFSMIPSVNIPRSVFNRSSGYKTTFDSGWLIPFFVDEALPGDTFHMKVSMLTRMSTPIVPVMDNLKLDYFFFSVPYRLLWDNWQRFNGEQTNPGDSVDYLIPQMKSGADGFAVHSLADYFGLPTGIPNLSVNALPFRAYNLIYNEWFRDENLIDSSVVNRGDAETDMTDYPLLKRCKRHDYFTSCLPWPQKGPGVGLGLAPMNEDLTFTFSNRSIVAPEKIDGVKLYSNHSNPGVIIADNPTIASPQATEDWDITSSNLSVSLANDDALTINSLRQAFQLQRMLERDARGGSRYTEILRSHFGVISPDARLQRPEYLGGGSVDININPVVQNSSTDDVSPQGNLAAFALSGAYRHGFSHSFTEHCFVIGLCSVRADLTYQQGIPRMFSRQTRYDHYWPTLAHLSEQAVLNKEIYAQGNEEDDKIFGYQERYAEYRYSPSKITGKFRSTDPQSLDVWHLSQKFENLPVLNAEFIKENPPLDRVLAVQSGGGEIDPTGGEPQFLMDCYFDLKCARPMPVYSVPGHVDHF